MFGRNKVDSHKASAVVNSDGQSETAPSIQEDSKVKAKKPNPVPQGMSESNIAYTIIKQYRLNWIFGLFASVLLVSQLLFGLYAVEVGKKRNLIVIRDGTGRVAQIITDEPTKIYQAELVAFVGDFIGEFFTWDYVQTMEKEQLTSKMKDLSRYFDQKFFGSFMQSLMSFFVKSISDERLVIRPGLYKITFNEVKGNIATVIFTVDMNLFKASAQGVEGGTTQTKEYKIEVQRGERTQTNLYGLYINSFSETTKSQ